MSRKLSREAKLYEKEQSQYEERERLFLEAKQEDGEFYKYIKDTNAITGIIIVIALACCIFLAKHYMSLGDKPVPAPPLTPNTVAQQQPQQQQETDAQQEQQRRKDEAEEEKEMKRLKEEFQPFQGSQDADIDPLTGMPTQRYNNNKHNNNISNNNIGNTNNNNIGGVDFAPPVQGLPTIEGKNNNTTQTYPATAGKPSEKENVPAQGAMPVNDMQKPPQNKQAYILKGISRTGETTYCYIEHNGGTGSYVEGDKVGEKKLESIGQNYVILSDEEGQQDIISM